MPSLIPVTAIDALLPQTQCGQCGHPGCWPYAQAIAAGQAINRCPPGGKATIAALAQLLQVPEIPLDPSCGTESPIKTLVVIREDDCIGCTKCIQACPVDAIVGAAKWMHTVIADICTGCNLCIPPCPVDCIDVIERPAAAMPPSEAQALQLAKANQSRSRFNARNARLAKKEAAKNAKKQQKTPTATAADTASPLVAEALARLAQQQQNPQQQLARLERQIASAAARVHRLEAVYAASIKDAAPLASQEKHHASLKQAQLQLADAHQKHAAFVTPNLNPLQEKLQSSPAQSLARSLDTLQKHLAVAQQKWQQAEATQAPNAAALKLGVEKLQLRLQQAQAEQQQLPSNAHQPVILDAATQAAANKVLAQLEARRQQSPEEKKAALQQSLNKRIEDIHLRLSGAISPETRAALETSLALLQEKRQRSE